MQTPFAPNKNAQELGIDLTRKFVIVEVSGYDKEIGIKDGEIVTINEDDNTDVPYFNTSAGERGLYWSQLAYADEPDPKANTPKFKVGDRVRITNADSLTNYTGLKNGDEFVIKEIHLGTFDSLEYLRKTEGIPSGITPDCVELVAAPQPLTFKEGGVYRVDRVYSWGKAIIKIINGEKIHLSVERDGRDNRVFRRSWSYNNKKILEDLTGKEFEHYPYKNPNYFGEEQLVSSPYGIQRISQKTINKLTNQPQGLIKKTMSSIKEFAKNMTLSTNEKLLRKHGLKDENGYTETAVEIIKDIKAKEIGFSDFEDLCEKVGASFQPSSFELSVMFADYGSRLTEIAEAKEKEEGKKK